MTSPKTWLQRKLDEPCACHSGRNYGSCCLRLEVVYFFIGIVAALTLFGTRDFGVAAVIPIFLFAASTGWFVRRYFQRGGLDSPIEPPRSDMSKSFKLTMIVLALFVELIFLGTSSSSWPHGEMADVRFRHKERIEAFFAYTQNPSPATKATFEGEMRLMHQHEDWKIPLAQALIIAANVTAIYCFWNYGTRKPVT